MISYLAIARFTIKTYYFLNYLIFNKCNVIDSFMITWWYCNQAKTILIDQFGTTHYIEFNYYNMVCTTKNYHTYCLNEESINDEDPIKF